VSVHLDTLFLPVSVVGFSCRPVGVHQRGEVRPPRDTSGESDNNTTSEFVVVVVVVVVEEDSSDGN